VADQQVIRDRDEDDDPRTDERADQRRGHDRDERRDDQPACGPDETEGDRDGDADDAHENRRDQDRAKQRPAVASGHLPAPRKPSDRARILHHDRGRVESERDVEEERQDAEHDEENKPTAQEGDRARRTAQSRHEGHENQEEGEGDESEDEELEQRVGPKDAEEPLEPPSEGPLQGHRLAAVPTDRVLRHGARHDAHEDRGDDERGGPGEEEESEVHGRQGRRGDPEETRANDDCPEDGVRDDRRDRAGRRAQDEINDEERQEVLRPHVEEAGEHVSEGRPPREGRVIRVRRRIGNIRRRRGGWRAGRRDDGSRGDDGSEAGPAVHAERVRRGVRGPAGGTRNRGGQARYLRRASGREVVESCGGWPTSGHVISSENRAGSFIRNRRNFAYSPRESMDINQLGLVLMGTVLGWFLLFAVRRYKVQWGAFAAFMAIVFGVSMMSFLYARDLLAYYGIGIFIGFVSNMIVRVAGTTAGGKLGEGLLEISAFERKG